MPQLLDSREGPEQEVALTEKMLVLESGGGMAEEVQEDDVGILKAGCMDGSVVESSPATWEGHVHFPAHAATAFPFGASLVAQAVKNPLTVQETQETWV